MIHKIGIDTPTLCIDSYKLEEEIWPRFFFYFPHVRTVVALDNVGSNVEVAAYEEDIRQHVQHNVAIEHRGLCFVSTDRNDPSRRPFWAKHFTCKRKLTINLELSFLHLGFLKYIPAWRQTLRELCPWKFERSHVEWLA